MRTETLALRLNTFPIFCSDFTFQLPGFLVDFSILTVLWLNSLPAFPRILPTLKALPGFTMAGRNDITIHLVTHLWATLTASLC